VYQPIPSYRLLLTWAAILSLKRTASFPARNELVLPDPVTLSSMSRCIWPQLPPNSVASKPYAFVNGLVHPGTNVGDDTYPPLHLPFVVIEPALAELAQVLTARKPIPLPLSS
jgi:hypothetical protein